MTVYVLVTHDNRFVNVYATRRAAFAEARVGERVRYFVTEVELTDAEKC